MLVTLSGIVTEVRGMQLKNAPLPMLVTLLPIVTEARELQAANALFPMVSTLSRSVRYLSDLLFRNGWAMDFIPNVRDSSASHPWNTFVPMLVTLEGIIIDSIALHP